MREEADSAWAEKGALGVRGHGRQGAAGTKCTPRKKIAQGSAPGSARFVLYEGGGRQRTAGRREERGHRRVETEMRLRKKEGIRKICGKHKKTGRRISSLFYYHDLME